MSTPLLLRRLEEASDVHQGSDSAEVNCGNQADRRHVLLLFLLEDAADERRGRNNAEAKQNQHGRWLRASCTSWCIRPNCRVGHAGERMATSEKENWTGVLF
jgi:hypothetical protein